MATETLADGTTVVGSCLGLDGSAIGMPQLCTDWMPNQIFWLVIALAAIYFFLSRIGLPRIGAVLAERQGTISNDIAAAEDMKLQAVAAERAYTEALERARADASRIVAEAKADIQKSLDAELARADSEISAKAAQSAARIADIRAGAVEAVTEVAKDTARELVAALGGAPDARAVTAAVSARMKR